MLTKCQDYLIFNWETLILVNVLKDQELAVPTSAFISTDILEAVYEKKSDVICSSFPPRCDIISWSIEVGGDVRNRFLRHPP